MSIDLVIFDWNIRPNVMQLVHNRQPIRFSAPRLSKFLLFEKGGQYIFVIGPVYIWPMEYHHFLLRNTYHSRCGMTDRCLGGGSLLTEVSGDGECTAQLTFWNACVCGTYQNELASHERDMEQAFGCKVMIQK
jgi:hypothetical protein